MNWSYGVCTIPERFGELLPRTLASLAAAGFDHPRLFVDGLYEATEYKSLEPTVNLVKKYQITWRQPRVRTFGNWWLAALELYLREPQADLFAIFQDDFVTYRNLRAYLEQSPYPPRGYWNLFTFPHNHKETPGWYLSDQFGKGAVALIFSGDVLRTLFTSKHFVERPLAAKGWKNVDGGVITALKQLGFQEYVHNPSLVQHTGAVSSIGNAPHPISKSFRGEDFDALELLTPKKASLPAVHESSNGQRKRVGLVGYNCASGLGELNRQIATYGDIDVWLIKPHDSYPTLPPPEVCDSIVCPTGDESKISQFLNRVDTVVFCETPYYNGLVDRCKLKHKRTVCVPMMEWMPPGANGWPMNVDLFLCPTLQCYNLFKHLIPCVHFPWPIDTQRFKFRPRFNANSFLFLNGNGGWHWRKGCEVIKEAKRIWPEFPINVRSQVQMAWPNGTNVLPPLLHGDGDLYVQGDVLVAPHSVDGLGLEPMEAMACGMPVITTDGAPWNENPALLRIKADVQPRKVKRPVDWYLPSPANLVSLCRQVLGSDIEQVSKDVRAWAESRSWDVKAEEFNNLVRYGVTAEKELVTA